MRVSCKVIAIKPLVIGVSSTALFNLKEADRIYKNEGLEAYIEFVKTNEDTPIDPGTAYHLIHRLLQLNNRLGEGSPIIETVLMSRNGTQTALPVIQALKQHHLAIPRRVFTNGSSIAPWLKPFGVNLFLSSNEDDVAQSAAAGIASAKTYDYPENSSLDVRHSTPIRLAFDGDAVLFGAESEAVYKQYGLDVFRKHEYDLADTPLSAGPLEPVFKKLTEIQSVFPRHEKPFEIGLFTARGSPADERVIRTFLHWGISPDIMLFLEGKDKTQFLQTFKPDIFFDDQHIHCERARAGGLPVARVP